MKIIESYSADETFRVGKEIGQTAKPGSVYTLIGDLGVGKTVFTQGVAKGLNITEPISSPTFTILQVYEEGRIPFYHFDVYRIGDVEQSVSEINQIRRIDQMKTVLLFSQKHLKAMLRFPQAR